MTKQEKQPSTIPSLPDRSDLSKRLYPTPNDSKKDNLLSTNHEIDTQTNGFKDILLRIVVVSAWLALPVFTFLVVVRIAVSLTNLEYFHIPLAGLIIVGFIYLFVNIHTKAYDALEKFTTTFSPNFPLLILLLFLISQLKLLSSQLITEATTTVIVSGTIIAFVTALFVTSIVASKMSDKKKVFILLTTSLTTYAIALII